MRTAIFVYAPTTLMFEGETAGIQLAQMNGGAIPLAAKLDVEPGIYKVVTTQRLRVTANPKTATVMQEPPEADPKQPYPQPPPKLPAMLVATTTEQIETFFRDPDLRDYDIAASETDIPGQ